MAIISVAPAMVQEYAGMGVIAAATMVGIMGLFNGVGRIGWATLSDFIGRPMMFMMFFCYPDYCFPSFANPGKFK